MQMLEDTREAQLMRSPSPEEVEFRTKQREWGEAWDNAYDPARRMLLSPGEREAWRRRERALWDEVRALFLLLPKRDRP
jgi:hypothetical protein